MTSTERRKEARYQRRKAKRQQKREERYKEFDSFERVLDGNRIYEAYRRCRNGVRYKPSEQRYRINLLRNILEQQQRHLSGKNLSYGFKEFNLNDRGKTRHIKAVSFKERVAQRTIDDNALAPLLQRNLIYDNGSSVKRKGNHWSLRRVEIHLKKFYRQNGFSNEGYILLLDLTKYFDSILHAPMIQIYEKEIQSERIINALKSYVAAFGDGKSMGIGSQISQISAVRYPSQIDHYAKEQLQSKFYARYMDDSYIVRREKDILWECLNIIRVQYAELGIILNQKKTQVISLKKGFTFLKTRFFLTATGKVVKKPVRDAVTKERRKLRKLFKKYANGEVEYEVIKQNLESWKSHIEHKNAHDTVATMQNYFNKLHTEAILSWSKKPTPTNPKPKSRTT